MNKNENGGQAAVNKPEEQPKPEDLKVSDGFFGELNEDPTKPKPEAKPEEGEQKAGDTGKPSEKTDGEAKPEEKKPEGGETKPEEKKEEKPVEKQKKVIKLAKGYEDLSPDKVKEIAVETGKAVAAEVAKVNQAKQPESPEIELTKSEKDQVKLVEILEAEYPERYPKGTAEKVATAFRKLNAGNVADGSDEYTKIWDEVGVTIDDGDIEEAKVLRHVAPIKQKLKEESERNARLEAEIAENKIAPVAARRANGAAAAVIEAIDPSLKEKVRSGINQDVITSIQGERDDGNIIAGAASYAARFVDAIHRAFNGVSTPMIDNVGKYCMVLERDIMADPEMRVSEEGLQFAPRNKFVKMSREERGKHWTLTPDIVEQFAIKDISDKASADAKAERDRVEAILKRKGIQVQSQPAPEQRQSTAAVKPSTVKPSADEKPATTGSPDASTGVASAGKKEAPGGSFWGELNG